MKKIFEAVEYPSALIKCVDSSGKHEIFHPNNDLKQAYVLLEEFLNDQQGSHPIRTMFVQHGRDWTGNLVHSLVWEVFLPYVQHQSLFHKIINGEIEVRFKKANRQRFARLMEYYRPSFQMRVSNNISQVINILIRIRNRCLSLMKSHSLLVMTLEDDHRIDEILYDFQKSSIPFNIINFATKKIVLRDFFSKKYFFLLDRKMIRRQKPSKDALKELYSIAFLLAEHKINQYVKQQSYYDNLMLSLAKDVKLFFGLDNPSFVYPLLYALKNRGVLTVGYQHGTYNSFLLEYTQKNLTGYEWFDHVVVWGEYWRDLLVKHGNTLPWSTWLLGTMKKKVCHCPSPPKGNRCVLVPYEQWVDTKKLGMFIEEGIKKGFKIYLKLRPDVESSLQIEAHVLSEEAKNQIIPVKVLDEMILDEIDVVLASFTSFLYECLSCEKIIWALDLETGFFNYQNLCDMGYARRITLGEFDRIEEYYQTDLSKTWKRDCSLFDHEKAFSETVIELLNGKRRVE